MHPEPVAYPAPAPRAAPDEVVIQLLSDPLEAKGLLAKPMTNPTISNTHILRRSLRNMRHPVPVRDRASCYVRTHRLGVGDRAALERDFSVAHRDHAATALRTTEPHPPPPPSQNRHRRRPHTSAPTPIAARPRAPLLRCRISPRRRTARRRCPWRSRRRRSPAHECNAPHARRRRPPASPIELNMRRATLHALHAGMRLQPTHPMQRALRAACDRAPQSRRMQCIRPHPSCTQVDTTRSSF
jgi:hypothetical protein